MRHVKVLALTNHLNGLLIEDVSGRLGISAEFVHEVSLGFPEGDGDRYNSSPELLRAIGGLFEREFFDIVLVGNNLGTGLDRVPLIPESLRERTIVTWNVYERGDEAPYVALDPRLQHFTSAKDAHEMIRALADGIVSAPPPSVVMPCT